MIVGNVSMKKGSLIFLDNLVANSLRVEGGNGAGITIAKDFYIRDTLDVQNHACIAVQGNFTAINKVLAKNKFYLFIYGDAYLPTSIDLKSNNNEIFVSGDVYVGGVKQQPKSLSDVPSGSTSNGCKLPGPGSSNDGNQDGENKPGYMPFFDVSEPKWNKPDVDVTYN